MVINANIFRLIKLFAVSLYTYIYIYTSVLLIKPFNSATHRYCRHSVHLRDVSANGIIIIIITFAAGILRFTTSSSSADPGWRWAAATFSTDTARFAQFLNDESKASFTNLLYFQFQYYLCNRKHAPGHTVIHSRNLPLKLVIIIENMHSKCP